MGPHLDFFAIGPFYLDTQLFVLLCLCIARTNLGFLYSLLNVRQTPNLQRTALDSTFISSVVFNISFIVVGLTCKNTPGTGLLQKFMLICSLTLIIL